MSHRAPVLVALVAVATTLSAAQKESPAPAAPPIAGVYQSIPNETVLPGGLRNAGSPEEVPLSPAGVEQMKSIDLAQDPEKMCQPIGPFRMMARAGTKIELAYAKDALVMLFEDISRGHIRTIYFNREHPKESVPTWLGDSVAKWDRDTLVIDTTGFNERTWLNAAGAQHSDALRLIERVKPVLDGKYLEYRMTAEDPQTLAKPYSYVRYFEKVGAEMAEDVCEM